MRYLFIGSSEYGLPALNKLIQNGYKPSLIISQPAKHAGRNRHIIPTPISEFADKQNLPLWTPENINSEEAIAKIAKYEAEIIITAAYGGYFKKNIRCLYPLGTVNLHPSLLPKYRGASPIQSAILNGEKETGTTLYKVTAKMDAGPILLQKKLPILDNETYSELNERLKQQAADLLWDFWKMLLKKQELMPTFQDESQASYCSKIDNNTCRINWQKNGKRNQ